jgi:hypothetical protein
VVAAAAEKVLMMAVVFWWWLDTQNKIQSQKQLKIEAFGRIMTFGTRNENHSRAAPRRPLIYTGSFG